LYLDFLESLTVGMERGTLGALASSAGAG